MKQFVEDSRYFLENENYNDLIRYCLSRKDLSTVKKLLLNVSKYTRDPTLQTNYPLLFLHKSKCQDMFGIGEDIINSMKNIVFSGNVNIKSQVKKAQDYIDRLYYEGDFVNTLKEAYRTAIATSGKSYLVMNLNSVYDVNKGVKEKDYFIDFSVYKTFEMEESKFNIEGNQFHRFKRKLYKEVVTDVQESKKEIWQFEYVYTVGNGMTALYVYGYNQEGKQLDEETIKRILQIDTLSEIYNVVTVFKIDVGDGMLPNILKIENSLAEGIYFQGVDLPNSQTQTYTAENALYTTPQEGSNTTYDDKYQTRHVIKTSLDGHTQFVVKGESAISHIERNMILSISRACLDAKISPSTISFPLVERAGNNTEVGLNRERNTVRLRENHINSLKIVIAKIIQEYLKLFNLNVTYEKITVIFDAYITPDVETLTNILSKQVQFGIKSRLQAITDLNKNELSDEDILKEYERVKELYTQKDFNVEQENERLKDKDKEEVDLKVDNVLKSKGNVE